MGLSSLDLLPVVYAYRDDEAISVPSRWQPRSVYCTKSADHADTPGVRYVVKYRQGRVGTAALVSEVICHGLLEAISFSTLEAALVTVSHELAASYRALGVTPYEVEPGRHFGTVRLDDVVGGPPAGLDQVARVQDVVDLWVFDTWVMNGDRRVFGNVLLRPDDGGKWGIIAVDHSDCFGGASYLADGSYLGAGRTHGQAAACCEVEAAVFQLGGSRCVRRAIDRVSSALRLLPGVMERVPQEWWELGGVEQAGVDECLRTRALNLAQIVRLSEWGDTDAIARGGVLVGS